MINITCKLFEGIKLDWLAFFENQLKKEYFQILLKNIVKEFESYRCYPPFLEIFSIFKIISLKEIKVVIFGQDPYHNQNQANGIAFSCKWVNNNKLPPTLINIFKELKRDLNIVRVNGDLIDWVKQGVFMYNIFLTVRENIPNSHANLGWKHFTIELIKYIEKTNKNIIYVIWGNKAKFFLKYIKSKNIILSSHPSPLSQHISFINSKPFSKINHFLLENNSKTISW